MFRTREQMTYALRVHTRENRLNWFFVGKIPEACFVVDSSELSGLIFVLSRFKVVF